MILLAAAIALVGVAIHLAAIVGGPSWYAYFNAPPSVVASARAGTWLAPVSAAIIALLMGLCAAYALSAAAVIGVLPLRRTMLAGMAFVCIARSLILIPFALKHPQLFNLFEVVAAIVWATAGMGFWVGYRRCSSLQQVKFEGARST